MSGLRWTRERKAGVCEAGLLCQAREFGQALGWWQVREGFGRYALVLYLGKIN